MSSPEKRGKRIKKGERLSVKQGWPLFMRFLKETRRRMQRYGSKGFGGCSPPSPMGKEEFSVAKDSTIANIWLNSGTSR
jgi:hypothetical protein